MKNLTTTIAIVALLAPSLASAAIAYDTSGEGFAESAASITISTMNIAVGATALVCAVGTNGGGTISSVTANGTSLDYITDIQGDGTNGRIWLYGLASPDSGTHDIVANFSVTAGLQELLCASYSGTDVTTPFGANKAQKKSDTSSSYTLSLTTTKNNSWSVFIGDASGGAPAAAGTGLTQRQIGTTTTRFLLADSGSAISPPQSYGMTMTYTSSLSDREELAVELRLPSSPSDSGYYSQVWW
ncbi:MAG: hypothetical protein NUV49_04115 [Patescibacteria group bacterium]|nr:hypothetical protein [Patescibacteria group bacterium]